MKIQNGYGFLNRDDMEMCPPQNEKSTWQLGNFSQKNTIFEMAEECNINRYVSIKHYQILVKPCKCDQVSSNLFTVGYAWLNLSIFGEFDHVWSNCIFSSTCFGANPIDLTSTSITCLALTVLWSVVLRIFERFFLLHTDVLFCLKSLKFIN